MNSRQSVPAVFYADTKPSVRKCAHPAKIAVQQLTHSLMPLCEDLESVPMSTFDRAAYARDVALGYILVKEVTH